MTRTIRWVALALPLLWPATAATYHVSPAGDDGHTGLGPEPALALRTPAAGIAKLQPSDTLLLRGGDYELESPLLLDAKLSGTADTPTRIAAYPGEQPRLTGFRAVTGFEPDGDGCYRAPWSGPRPEVVTVDGRWEPLARYPNLVEGEPFTSGWAYADAPPDTIPAELGPKRVVRQRPADRRHWADATLGRISIFSGHEWWNNLVPIVGSDAEGGLLRLKADCSYDITAEDRYFIEGLPEELDAPGEWSLTHDGRNLRYRPRRPGPPANVLASRPGGLLRIDGATSVVVDGLSFSGCEAAAVVVSNGDGCRVSRCVVSHVGSYGGVGVAVYGGRGNVVEGCRIEDTGSSGITISGGDPVRREPAGNRAVNNLVREIGRVYKQGSGIAVNGVGNQVDGNTIHDVPRWAVVFGGTDHVIERNRMYGISLETTDTGAVYGGSLNWLSAHGTVIRHNWIDGLVGRGRRDGEWRAPFYCWGIYLDWSAMGVTVEGNLVVGAPRAGIMVHDGRFNTIRGNLIVDCGTGRWDDPSQIEFSGWHDQHFFWLRGLDFGWVKQFESAADQPAWHTADSTLRDPRQSTLPDGRTMHDNRVERNVLAWTNPVAKAIYFRNADYAANPSDHNLVWAGGAPVRTGLHRIASLTGPELVPNAALAPGGPDGLPGEWTARIPWDGCSAKLEDGAIHLVGRSSEALASKPDWDRQVAVQTRFITGMEPGRSYAAKVRLRANAPATKARLEALSYRGEAYDVRFTQEMVVGTEPTPCEVTFRFPEPGDKTWHDGMLETFYLRVILRQDDGELWLDQPSLREAVPMDEWAAWQASGQDLHSVLADPRFVDPLRPELGLRPDSPAFGLGWQAFPFETAGCDHFVPYRGAAR